MRIGEKINIDQKAFYIHNLDKRFEVCKFTSELKDQQLYNKLFEIADKQRSKQPKEANYQKLPELLYITSKNSQQTGLYLLYDHVLVRLYGECVYIDQTNNDQLQKQIDDLQQQLDNLKQQLKDNGN